MFKENKGDRTSPYYQTQRQYRRRVIHLPAGLCSTHRSTHENVGRSELADIIIISTRTISLSSWVLLWKYMYKIHLRWPKTWSNEHDMSGWVVCHKTNQFQKEMFNEWCVAALGIYSATGKELNVDNEWSAWGMAQTIHKFYLWKGRYDNIQTGLIFTLANAPQAPCQICQATPCVLTTGLTTSMSWFLLLSDIFFNIAFWKHPSEIFH